MSQQEIDEPAVLSIRKNGLTGKKLRAVRGLVERIVATRKQSKLTQSRHVGLWPAYGRPNSTEWTATDNEFTLPKVAPIVRGSFRGIGDFALVCGTAD